MLQRTKRTPSQQNIDASLEMYLGIADQNKCGGFFFSPQYNEICKGTGVKIPALSLLLKTTT